MDGTLVSMVVLNVVIALVVLYALYLVIRAAVRDGIGLARAKEAPGNEAAKTQRTP